MAGALGLVLAGTTALMPTALHFGEPASVVVLGGLGVCGVLFALNSSVHSYLVLAYSAAGRVSMDVGSTTWRTPLAASEARCCPG